MHSSDKNFCRVIKDLTFVGINTIRFFTRNDVSTTVTPSVVAKVDYSTAASPLALPDARKPDLHPPEDTKWNNR
ncbi:hypothetical protein Hanom_Chr01g00092061 [Helianthus anomalus]